MTNTEIIVRMVEAGLGIAIVPLLPSGIVTRSRRVGIRGLGQQIRPIQSGILTRRAERLPPRLHQVHRLRPLHHRRRVTGGYAIRGWLAAKR